MLIGYVAIKEVNVMRKNEPIYCLGVEVDFRQGKEYNLYREILGVSYVCGRINIKEFKTKLKEARRRRLKKYKVPIYANLELYSKDRKLIKQVKKERKNEIKKAEKRL